MNIELSKINISDIFSMIALQQYNHLKKKEDYVNQFLSGFLRRILTLQNGFSYLTIYGYSW